MVFPTFGSSVKGGNKDAAFHTLTLVRLKGVGQGGLAMMSDLDMSGNKLMNAQAIDTANLTSSNGVINVINADMNIENNELRVKRFKTDELASKTANGAIDIRSKVRLANSDAQTGALPTGDPDTAYVLDNDEWTNWNDLEARDITCRTLNYTEINPSISGIIKNVYTAKNQAAKTLKSFYVNDTTDATGNYTLATTNDGMKLNLTSTSTSVTDLSPATTLVSSKYIFNITARLNHLPDDHLAYFFVATNTNGNIENTYVKGVKDTLVTLMGTTGAAVTEIKLYGSYSYSPNTNIEVQGQNSTSEQYVTVSDIVLTAFECTDITDKTSTSDTVTLTVTVTGLVNNDCVFVRLNENEITQQLVEGVEGNTDRTVVFTIGKDSAYSITAFIPHDINVEINTTTSNDLVGEATADKPITLGIKQNFVLTVNVTGGVVVSEDLKLNLLLNTYNETISYSTSTSKSFPQITTTGNYKLSVLPDNTGFINYQISESTVDPESFPINETLTVDLTVIRLYKISVTVPTLTNGSLKVKLDYTGEVLTFTTGGTQSFLVGVPDGVKINIYSFESPNYQGIKNQHTVATANYTLTGMTLTPLYSVSIVGTNLTSNEVALTLKTNTDTDITENYYNVLCSTTYANAFDLTTTAGDGIKYNDVNTTISLNGTPTLLPLEGIYQITDLSLVFYYIPTGEEVYIISGTSGGTLTNSIKSASRNVNFDLTLMGETLTGSSSETHTTGVTYAYTVKEGRLINTTFDYLNTGIITPDLEGTSSITLKSTNTSGIFPYRLINDTTVKVTDDQGTSYKTLSNQTITIPSADVVDANVVDTITFIPLSEITVNLVNLVPGRDIILAVVNINGQSVNPATDANTFNIPTTGIATLTLTYVTAEYNLGTTPTTTTPSGLDTIATFAISGDTSITMFPLYKAMLDLSLMTVLNSKLTFSYDSVSYIIYSTGTNTYTINGILYEYTPNTPNYYTLSEKLPYDSLLPVVSFLYYPNIQFPDVAAPAALNWTNDQDKIVDNNETLAFSLEYTITIQASTVSLYKKGVFKTIFDTITSDAASVPILNKTYAGTLELFPKFIKDDKYYLISTKNIPDFYGIISSGSKTLLESTKYELKTVTKIGPTLTPLNDVNFKLESNGAALNHFDYYEIMKDMKDVGTFKTPLYSGDNYSVGATYISTESTPTVTGPGTGTPTPTGNIFYNTVITGTDNVKVTVTIPNGTQDYTSSMLGTPTETLSNGTYIIRGNLLGGQYLINDLEFTYDGTSFTINSGSAVRLYSNVECNVNLFVNVATPIGGTYADSTITYVSGDYTGGAFTIDGSKLGGGDNLTGASIVGTTKAISGTFAGDKPQYFTNVPADAVGGVVNTFDVKYTPNVIPANANIIITLNTNTDTFSGGTTGQAYTLTNFDGVNNLDFTLKGISTTQTGIISSGQELTFTPTYNISGANAYTTEDAELSVDTNPEITKIVDTGTYTINSLQLLQDITRILSITSSKHLFSDFTLSRTFTDPNGDQTNIDLIARYETITFTFNPTQTSTTLSIKRTGANTPTTSPIDGSVNQFELDLDGATAATYDYTATLGNGLEKSLTNQTASASEIITLTLTLSKLTLPSTLSANTLNITGSNSTSNNFGQETYVFQGTNYTLKGTYTNNAIAMLYDYTTTIQVGTSDITVTIPVYTFKLNFGADTITAGTSITLTLEVYNGETNGVPNYNVYFTSPNLTSNTNHTFSNIPVGCKYKLKRTGSSDKTLSYITNNITYTATATSNYFTDGNVIEFIMTDNIDVDVSTS